MWSGSISAIVRRYAGVERECAQRLDGCLRISFVARVSAEFPPKLALTDAKNWRREGFEIGRVTFQISKLLMRIHARVPSQISLHVA